MKTILFFAASGLVWGLLELYFGFTLGHWLLGLVEVARGGGI